MTDGYSRLPVIQAFPPESLGPAYRGGTAYKLALYCQRIYGTDPCLGRLGSWCVVLESPTTQAKCLIEDVGDCVVVAFRGSQSIEDYMQDAKFIRKPIGLGMSVHVGFWEDINSLIGPLVKKLRGIGKPVICTGHSLGADQSILGAYLMLAEGIQIRSVYAIAPARPGNEAFARWYNRLLGSITYCIVRPDDPVPMVPTLLMGARRAGQMIYLNEPGKFRLNPSFNFMVRWNLLGIWRSWRHLHSAFLPNHHLEKYLGDLS